MDSEKVIKELENLQDSIATNRMPDAHKAIGMISDAIAILKEREAVVPTLIREGRNKNYNDYVCPRCDNEVVYEQNYCSECGIPFLWESR